MNLSDFILQYEHVLLDFDGVIVDSCGFKVTCIKETFSDYPEKIRDEFASIFKKNFGKTRESHFQYFYNEYTDRSISFSQFYEKYASRYATLLEDGYRKCQLCDGASDFIQYLAKNRKNLYIVTGSKPNDALEILKQHDLAKHFSQVLGSPDTKITIINRIIPTQARSHSIFIGDTVYDFQAAQETSLEFLFSSKYAANTFEDLISNQTTPFYFVNTLELNSETQLIKESEQV